VKRLHQVPVNKFIANLLIPFSGFYCNRFIDPVDVVFVLCVFLSLTYIMLRGKLFVESTILLVTGFVGYLCLTQPLIGGKLSTTANVLLSLLYFVITVILTLRLDIQDIISLSNRFIFISMVLLIVDCVLRLTHPAYSFDDYRRYKMGGFLYQDSNFVGTFIVVLFFLAYFLHTYGYSKQRLSLILLFCLAICTFSRASILTIILFYFTFRYLRNLSMKTLIPAILTGGIIIGLVLIYNKFFFTKDSIALKFLIITRSRDFWWGSPLMTKLIGVGFANTYSKIGIGSHNIIVTYLMESGVIGVAFLLILWWIIVLKTRFKALLILLPFGFNAMSLAGHGVPYLYCVLGLLYVIHKKEISRHV
jgi:hypothetical protein